MKLHWNWDEECKCHRAFDDIAIYVISGDAENGYNVGYFPGPGPECKWRSGLNTLEEAKAAAEDCIQHVVEVRRKMGLNS